MKLLSQKRGEPCQEDSCDKVGSKECENQQQCGGRLEKRQKKLADGNSVGHDRLGSHQPSKVRSIPFGPPNNPRQSRAEQDPCHTQNYERCVPAILLPYPSGERPTPNCPRIDTCLMEAHRSRASFL